MSRSVPSVREDKSRQDEPRQARIEPKMLDLLVCPQTHGALTYDREAQELISKKARLAYPVRDGVPLLVVSEARIFED